MHQQPLSGTTRTLFWFANCVLTPRRGMMRFVRISRLTNFGMMLRFGMMPRLRLMNSA
jgi:hypothetical protein